MTRQITFIHASDLHLGVSFKGLRALSETWANRLLSAVSESYDRMISVAIEKQVDFVVIAGDIFDSTQTSYADYLHFLNGLNKLSSEGIAVYLCAGNHDPLTSWQQDFSELPSNTYIFPGDKPGFIAYEKEGETLVLLGGRSYQTKTWPSGENISSGITKSEAEQQLDTTAPFAIGIIHTGLNIDLVQAPVDPQKLMTAGMDYWALGHIHERMTLPETDPTVVYSGCMQGRSINETGEKGVYFVTLTEGEPNKLEFIPTASVVWQQILLDIALCSSVADVGEKIVREMVRATENMRSEEVCARVTLTGKSNLHKALSAPGVIDDLRDSINDMYPYFYCDTITNNTRLPLDKTALQKEGLFPSVFMQASQALRSEKEAALDYIQDAFLERGVALTLLQGIDVEQLANEAEDEVLDMLGNGGEQ